MIVLLVGLVWLDYWHNFGRPGVWLLPLGVLVCVLAVAEVLQLLEAKNLRPIPGVVYAGVLLVFLAAAVPLWWPNCPDNSPLGRLGWPLLALALAVGLAFVGEMQRYRRPGGVMVNVALATFAFSYLGLLMSFLVTLRIFSGNEWGMVALLSLIVVVKLSDAGAYTAGRLWGRHRMAPVLSPGKTVQGAVGGLVAACVGSWLMFDVVAPMMVTGTPRTTPWWSWLSYGVVVCVAGMLGDLAESLFKRDLDQKDSSRWLPGLGGVLDLIDSILFAAPAAYLCWVAKLVGP